MKMSSQSSGSFLPPQNLLKASRLSCPPPSKFNFTPIGPAPTTAGYIPQAVKPVPNIPDPQRGHTPHIVSSASVHEHQNPPSSFLKPASARVTEHQNPPPSFLKPASAPVPEHQNPPSSFLKPSHKRKPGNCEMIFEPSNTFDEPQRKLHVTDDFVAQTMSELYISNPKPKVARRNAHRDVSEAMNLEGLHELEERFSNQGLQEDYSLPPLRNRKVPARNRNPQLRLTLHQDLKNLRSNNPIPETLINRYRPSPRQGGSTALVLWKPPGGFIPDVITSVWRPGRGRTRCVSEVTSTPYSSHEDLLESERSEMVSTVRENGVYSPASAEAPELSSPLQDQEDMIPSTKLQRRNSAPEISEPLPFLDHDGSMEL